MNYKDGVYTIDSDSDKTGGAEKNILTWMVCFRLLSIRCIYLCVAATGNSPGEVSDDVP
jgi:hypothetical protein